MTQKADSYSVKKSDAEWKKELDPLQHHVLRDHGTERPFTSPLNNEKRAGTFRCAGCGEPLFDSGTKYESGSGWPSASSTAAASRRRRRSPRQAGSGEARRRRPTRPPSTRCG